MTVTAKWVCVLLVTGFWGCSHCHSSVRVSSIAGTRTSKYKVFVELSLHAVELHDCTKKDHSQHIDYAHADLCCPCMHCIASESSGAARRHGMTYLLDHRACMHSMCTTFACVGNVIKLRSSPHFSCLCFCLFGILTHRSRCRSAVVNNSPVTCQLQIGFLPLWWRRTFSFPLTAQVVASLMQPCSAFAPPVPSLALLRQER